MESGCGLLLEEWFDLFLVRGQRGVDHLVHVVVLVRAQTAAYSALSASVLIG